MELINLANYSVVAFLLIFSFYLLLLKSSKPIKDGHKAPPEAGGARPLTGHLHVMSTGLPHINLGTLADKYGPIFKIRLGVRPVVVVSGSELVKELFTTNDAAVSCRPTIKSGEHLSYNNAMVGFAAYGAYWRELRKLLSLELFSARRVELERDVRASETARSIRELYKLWENKKDGSGRVLVDMKHWFGCLNMNVVLMMVAGKRFDSGDEAAETRRCRAVMRDFFHLAGFFVPADALPYLRWLDLGGYEKKMKQNAKEFDQVVGGWLAEHREKELSGQDKPRDFMDVMLKAVKGANFQGKYDVDTIIKATCGNLIAGGTDTTTIVLIWTLSLLLNNHHVLNKAQEELDKHVGRNRKVNESDINNLIYLQAIIKEVLRLYPPGPLAGTRKFTKDCNVGDYHIPKDTWLIVNLSKLHRDPKVWNDPLKFRPERFLSEHKNVDIKGQNFELIPFGAGRRICPGTNFGLHVLRMVLANLLQAFEFSTLMDEEIDMSESDGLTNMKTTPLDVLIFPRLNPSLY